MAYQFEDLRQKLKDYFEKIFTEEQYDDNQADALIASCKLTLLLSDLFKIKVNRIKAESSKLFQARINQIFRAEIQKLAEGANQNNIKLVLLKGVSIADKYYPNEKMRIISDIDLFVSPGDFSDFINICKENGYALLSGEEISDQCIQDYLSAAEIERSPHFHSIVKYIDSYTICIDVHISLFLLHWFGEKCHTIPRDFYARSIRDQNGIDKELYELELHDLIIYQQIHFIQHFYKNIWEGFCSGSFVLQKKVNLLFELACIITKEHDNISWDYYCDLCLKYEIDMEMAAVCVFINQIAGMIIPREVIDRLCRDSKQYEKRLFYDFVCRNSLEKKLSDLLVRPETDFAHDLVQSAFLQKRSYICTQMKEKSLLFCINGSCENKSFYVCGSKEVADYMKAFIRLDWDFVYLNIYIQAMYHDVPILNDTKNDEVAGKDPVLIIVYNYKNGLNVKRIDISLKGEIIDNRYGFEVFFIQSENEKNVLNVRIKWSSLNISPEVGSSFGFNLVWEHYDDILKKFARLSLSGNPCWHDIVGLKRIDMIRGAS